MSNQSGHYAITNLYVRPESSPFEAGSSFTLRGKGWRHYLLLFTALLSVGLALYALILCVRTPIAKRKWLWAIVTILGLGKFGIEWSTGELWYRVFYLSVLPAGWGFDVESPFLYASIPAGALLFLFLRSRLARVPAAAPAIDPDKETGITEQSATGPGQ